MPFLVPQKLPLMGFIVMMSQMAVSGSAIRVSVPPSDGFRDIAANGSQHIESNAEVVYDYLQLINEYLWFSIAVIVFAAVGYAWYKFLTSTWGGDEAKTTLKNVVTGTGVGILVVVMSYTIVRLVINLF